MGGAVPRLMRVVARHPMDAVARLRMDGVVRLHSTDVAARFVESALDLCRSMAPFNAGSASEASAAFEQAATRWRNSRTRSRVPRSVS